MLLEERTVIETAVQTKGRKLVAQQTVGALTALAGSIGTVVEELEADPIDGARLHDAWDRLEWSVAAARIALDELTVAFMDDPADRHRAILLRAKAAELGLMEGGGAP